MTLVVCKVSILHMLSALKRILGMSCSLVQDLMKRVFNDCILGGSQLLVGLLAHRIQDGLPRLNAHLYSYLIQCSACTDSRGDTLVPNYYPTLAFRKVERTVCSQAPPCQHQAGTDFCDQRMRSSHASKHLHRGAKLPSSRQIGLSVRFGSLCVPALDAVWKIRLDFTSFFTCSSPSTQVVVRNFTCLLTEKFVAKCLSVE